MSVSHSKYIRYCSLFSHDAQRRWAYKMWKWWQPHMCYIADKTNHTAPKKKINKPNILTAKRKKNVWRKKIIFRLKNVCENTLSTRWIESVGVGRKKKLSKFNGYFFGAKESSDICTYLGQHLCTPHLVATVNLQFGLCCFLILIKHEVISSHHSRHSHTKITFSLSSNFSPYPSFVVPLR